MLFYILLCSISQMMAVSLLGDLKLLQTGQVVIT